MMRSNLLTPISFIFFKCSLNLPMKTSRVHYELFSFQEINSNSKESYTNHLDTKGMKTWQKVTVWAVSQCADAVSRRISAQVSPLRHTDDLVIAECPRQPTVFPSRVSYQPRHW